MNDQLSHEELIQEAYRKLEEEERKTYPGTPDPNAVAVPAEPPKRKRLLEPCRKCGKPTKYGPSNPVLYFTAGGVSNKIGALCSVCLKIEGPKALAAIDAAGLGPDITDRTTEPTSNNRTGSTDDPTATPPASPMPCSEPSSTPPIERPALPCPNCGQRMITTETGYRCQGCTEKLRTKLDPGECVGCDYNEGGECTQTHDPGCPILQKRPQGTRGPFTAAEEARGKAYGELAAEALRDGCGECDAPAGSQTWEPRDRRGRLGIELTCPACGSVSHHLVTGKGLYTIAVSDRLIVVLRRNKGGDIRAHYNLDQIAGVSVCEAADHDSVTFRAGGESQHFSVEDAEPLIDATTKLWGAG